MFYPPHLMRRFNIQMGFLLVLGGVFSNTTGNAASPSGYSQPASHVTLTTARLNGSVVPNGTTTHAWFEWGTNSSFNRVTSSTNVGSGSALVYVSMSVTGLVAHQEYRYRLVTSNALGVVVGRVIPFATGYEITGWGTEYYGEITKSFSITNVTALAYGLALKTDGTVAAWEGADTYGQTNVPPGVSNIIGVATGSGYSMAVRSNGTVTAWGKNDYGQTNVPAGLSNVVTISSGWYGHAFALKSDGRAVGWGYNAFGQASVPSICTNLIQIVGCAESSMALRADNTLIFWGDNARGQLNAPNNLTNVVAIAAGYGHNLALQADGTVRAWGWSSYGQTNVPAGLSNVIAIAAGYSHSLAILADGTVRAWGDNFYKQSTVSPALNDVVAVASQLFATYALTKTSTGRPLTGTIAYTRPAAPVRGNGARLNSMIDPGGIGTTAWFEWGTNTTYGQITTATNLGNGTNVIHFSASLTNLVFGGTYHCRVVASNSSGVVRGQDRLFCTAALIGKWGAAGGIPVTGAQTGFVAIDAGVTHDMALKSDGTVVAWGDNEFNKGLVPPGLSNVATIAASQYSSFAIKDDGVGEIWGYTSYPPGSQPGVRTNVINLQAAPYYSTVALFADGTLTVGSSYTNTNVVAISCSSSIGIGLKIDGKVFVWGTGNDSQDVPLDLGNVVDVACGSTHRLALRSDGIVVGWGANNYGQLDIPAGLNNVRAIAAGQYHSVALKSDGSIVSWGSVAHTNFPPGLSNVVSVEAGANYNLYLYEPTRGAPQCFTRAPAPLTTTNALLNGTVLPNGRPTTAWFEWGNSTVYGNTSLWFNAGSWITNVQINFLITNLLPATVYHCRIVCSNEAGIAFGPNHMFRTGSKVSAWGFFDYSQTTIPPGLSNAVSISSGWNSSCALKADGKVVAWGRNEYGQTNVPASLSNVVVIASGGGHNLALKQDGTIAAWGWNGYGQATVPSGLSDVVAIAAGGSHSLALKADGSVVAWGWNAYGQTNQVAGLNNVVAIAAGGVHNLALRADGRVITWGADFQDFVSVPTGLSNVVAIAAGQSHSLALKHDGTVVAWWANYDNQISVPAGLSNVVSIAAGVSHSLAVRTDGSVVWWGRNNYGQTTPPVDLEFCVGLAGGENHTLALANRPPVAIPQTVPALFNQDTVLKLIGTDANADQLGFKISSLPAAGALYQFTTNGRGAAINSPGAVVADASGRVIFAPETNALATPYTSFSFVANDGDSDSTPALVSLGIAILKPYAIAQPTTPLGNTALTFNGVVTPNNSPTTAWFEWGETSSYGQTTAPLDVGNGVAPVRVSIATSNLTASVNFHSRLVASNSIGITLGGDFIFTTGEKVSAWGGFGNSVLKIPPGLSNTVVLVAGDWHALALKANGTVTAWGTSPNGQTNTPAGLSNIIAIASGQLHNLALRSDGTVAGWGLNQNGQATTPAGLSNVIAIAAGISNSFALKADGGVVSWGQNVFGETEIPPGLNGVVAIASGRHHVMALRHDGSLTAWGNSDSGQTNIPPSATNIIAISAGDYHSLALRSDGNVFSWGFSEFGQGTVPASATNVVAIASSRAHCLALRADGQIVGWGRNEYGQSSPPSALSNVVAVAAGRYHSLAVRSNGTVFAWGLNTYGQVTVPANATNVIAVAAGDSHSMALRVDGSVVVWGNPAYGQTTIPVGLSNVVSIAAGAAQSLAIGNVRPAVLPRSFFGAANSDLLVTLSGSDTNSDVLIYRVANIPAAGKLYQYAAGTRGGLLTDGDGVSDSQRRLIFAPHANAYGSPYTNFNYFANDGQFNSATSAVTLTIAAPIRPTITGITRTNNNATSLTFTGHSNTTYCVWASTNLVTWEYLGLPTQSVAGIFQFLAATSSPFSQRFYRISTGCETPRPQLQSNSAMIGGGFDLRFSGGAYCSYHVWASTNLLNWELIGVGEESQVGNFRFVDPNATGLPRRFYRAAAP